MIRSEYGLKIKGSSIEGGEMRRDSYTPRIGFTANGDSGLLPDMMGAGSPRKEYPEGRVCKWEGCDTRLSIHNPGEHCSLHKGAKGKPLSSTKSR